MNVKKIRIKKSLTVSQLVKLSNVPRRTIEDIERNNNCKVNTALKLAEALEVSLDELCAN